MAEGQPAGPVWLLGTDAASYTAAPVALTLWVAVGSCQSIEYFFKYFPNIHLFFLQKGSVILHGGRGKDFSVFVGKEPLKKSTLYTVRKMGKLWDDLRGKASEALG